MTVSERQTYRHSKNFVHVITIFNLKAPWLNNVIKLALNQIQTLSSTNEIFYLAIKVSQKGDKNKCDAHKRV